MKGPPEKGDQFAVLEYMKAGLLVTHPCASPSKYLVLHSVPVPFPGTNLTAATFPRC